jgi:hypothetical protein
MAGKIRREAELQRRAKRAQHKGERALQRAKAKQRVPAGSKTTGEA